MQLREIMTSGVVTAEADASAAELAQRMTQEVIEGALPQFFFHERG